MDMQQIEDRVRRVDALKGDDEMAHDAEDQLREDFIRFIAESGPHPLREMAAKVLQTSQIEFCRWCA